MSLNSEDVYLIQILDQDLVRTLDGAVKEKLEAHLKKKDESFKNLKHEMQQLEEGSRKKVDRLERELQMFSKKLEMAETFNCNLRKHVSDVEAMLQNSRKEYFDALSEKSQVSIECDTLKEQIRRTAQEKEDLNFLLDCKVNVINLLQNEIKELTGQVRQSSEQKLETTLKEGEFGLKECHLQQREEQMKHEKELYSKQIESLNNALDEKARELTAVRRERALQTLELQSALEQKAEEINKMEKEINRLKSIIDEKCAHTEELAKRIREMQECSVELETQFHNETAAQSRIIDTHKEEIEQEKRRNKHLFETIEKMQSLLQTANKANSDFEQLYNSSILSYQQKIAAKDSEIKTLRSQLEETKEQLAEQSRKTLQMEMESYFPAAASTSKVFKANMSLTQVYSEVVRLRDKLKAAEEENEKLKEQMSQIISEAEERGPFMYRKIREHQVASDTVIELRTHLTKLTAENEKLRKEKDEQSVNSGNLTRELKRLERENADLAMQVRSLVKAVHEARGFFVQDNRISSSDDAGAEDTSTNKIISLHLVTFKDIESLQAQNQKLLSALRDLGERQEELDKQLESNETAGLRHELEGALKEIESLKAERRQQMELLDNLVQQRDVNKSFSLSTSKDVGGDTSTKSMNSSFTEETLLELKKTIERLSEEYGDYKREAHCKVDELNNEISRYRDEISTLNVEKAKHASECEYLKEKMDISSTNLEQLEKAVEMKSQKQAELAEKVKKLEQDIELKKQEVAGAHEQIAAKDLKIESLKSEIDVLKRHEHNLLHERQTFIEQHQEKVQLLSTLQSFQSKLDKMEFESSKSMKVELDNALKEIAFLKEKLEKEQNQHKASSSALEKRFRDMQTRLDLEMQKCRKAEDELAKTKATLLSAEQELAVLKQEKAAYKVENQEKGTSTERSLQVSLQLKIKEKQLSECQLELKTLREKLLQIQKSYEGQKSLNTNLESKLSEQVKLSEEQKQNFDKTLVEKVREVSTQKEEKIKKMSAQAKQRMAMIVEAKDALIAEKEDLLKKLEETNRKKMSLEQVIEESALRLKTLQSQYEAKMRRQEKDLLEAQEANNNNQKQLEKLQSQIMQASQITPKVQTASSSVPSSTTPSAPVMPVVSSACSSTPPRHPVLPQQQQHPQPKSTPTASIRPLPMTGVSRVSARTSSTSQARSATVVPVQPTTDDSSANSLSSLPQATVTPTQTVPSLAVVPPTAVQDLTPSTTTATSTPTSPRGLPVETSEQTVDEREEPMVTHDVEPSTSDSVELSSGACVVTEATESEMTAPLQSTEQPPVMTAVGVSEAQSTADHTTVSATPTASLRVPSPVGVENIERATPSGQAVKRSRESPQPECGSSDDASKRRKLTEADTMQQLREHEAAIPCEQNEAEGMSEAEAEQAKNVAIDQNDSSDDIIVLESDDETEEHEDGEEGKDGEEDEEEEEDEEIEGEEDEGEEDEDEAEAEGEYDEEDSESSVGENSEGPTQERYEEYDEDGQDSSNQGEEDEEEEYPVDVDEPNQDADQSQDVQIIAEESGNQSSSIVRVAAEESEPNINNEPTGLGDNQSAVDVATSDVSQPSTSQQSFMHAPSALHRNLSAAVRNEQRLASMGRQSLYLSQSGAFEDGDDGIVPSTPTLCVPRRGESFVESLNSPRVPQNRFVFAQTTETPSGLAQLASQGALGVDDTRMDLSQFDGLNSSRNASQPSEPEPDVSTSMLSDGSNIPPDAPSTSVEDVDSQSEGNLVINSGPSDEMLSRQSDTDENKGDELIVAGDVEPDEGEGEGDGYAEAEAEAESVTPQVSECSDEEGQVEEKKEEEGDSEGKDQNPSSTSSRPISTPKASTTSPVPVRFAAPQVARRGRIGRSGAQSTPRPLQRRPVVWNPDPTSSGRIVESASSSIVSQAPGGAVGTQASQLSHAAEGTRGRRIRLRGSRYSVTNTRGTSQWRGARPPRSRGGFY